MRRLTLVLTLLLISGVCWGDYVTYEFPTQDRENDYELLQPDITMLKAFSGLYTSCSIIYHDYTADFNYKIKITIPIKKCYVIFYATDIKAIKDKAKIFGLKEIKVKDDLSTVKLKAEYTAVTGQ